MIMDRRAPSTRKLALWALPFMLFGGIVLVWADWPSIDNVTLNTPADPSSEDEYSSAQFSPGTTPNYGNSMFGSSLTAVGDFNNDGYEDLVVGSYAWASSRGSICVYYGSADAPAGTQPVSGAVVISGATSGYGSRFGFSLAVGDLTGDGVDDLAVGAPAPNTTGNSGAVYVLPGIDGSQWSDGQAVTEVNGVITLTGHSEGDEVGYSVAVGDIGKGTDSVPGMADLIVGAPGISWVYVLFGPLAPGASLTLIPVDPGSTTVDEDAAYENGAGTRCGESVAVLGDVDGNGHNDIGIGAPEANYGGGNVYLLGGRDSQYLPKYLYLPDPANLKKVILGNLRDGSSYVGNLGRAISAIGDVNDDGWDDVGIRCK